MKVSISVTLIEKPENLLGVKPLIHQSELRTYTKVVLFKRKKFLSLCRILKFFKCNDINQIRNWRSIYIMIILSPNLVAFSCILILYGGFDTWDINTEFLEMTLLFLE